jgi:hypothetical protein
MGGGTLLLSEATAGELAEMLRRPKFLDLAVGGEASILVTGDDDLLTLNPFRGVRILTPAEFLATLGEQN